MKLNLVLHLLAQILAQGAVVALVPAGHPAQIFAAVVAIVGVLAAFFDQSVTTS